MEARRADQRNNEATEKGSFDQDHWSATHLFCFAACRAAIVQRRARVVARPSRGRSPPWNHRALFDQALQGRHKPSITHSFYHDWCRSLITISSRPAGRHPANDECRGE
jgi:hypothetical protein